MLIIFWDKGDDDVNKYLENVQKKIQSGNHNVSENKKQDGAEKTIVTNISDYDGLNYEEKLVRIMIGDQFIKNFKLVSEKRVVSNWDTFRHNLDKYLSSLAKSNYMFQNFAIDLVDDG